MCNPSRSRGSAPAERDCGWTVFRITCTGDGGTFLAVEKTERPPRPPGYNVEAKRGSFQMDSISHQRRCNFSPSTLDSGGAGGGALTPRCAKTPEHTAPSPEVVRNTVHLPYGLVLVRGKVHAEVFDEHFPGETGEGMALFARKLPGILRRRFRKESTPGGLPRVVFTDKGKAFYRTSPDGGWPIVRAWKAELSINILCQVSRSYPLRHSLHDVSHVYVVGGAGGGRASPLRRRARQWPAWGHSRCHSSRDCRGVGESTAREDDPTSRVGGVEGSLRRAGACRDGVREPRIRRGGALRKLRRSTRGSRGEEGRPPEQVMGDNESQ